MILVIRGRAQGQFALSCWLSVTVRHRVVPPSSFLNITVPLIDSISAH